MNLPSGLSEKLKAQPHCTCGEPGCIDDHSFNAGAEWVASIFLPLVEELKQNVGCDDQRFPCDFDTPPQSLCDSCKALESARRVLGGE